MSAASSTPTPANPGSASSSPPSAPQMERISYGGWPNCVRLYNEEIELVATTDVGPRIIRMGFNGGENLFKEYESQLGQTGGDEWRIYGGHRLWHAPEQEGRTYAPDNEAIDSRWTGSELILHQPTEPSTGIAKEMAVSIGPRSNQVVVRHRLMNTNAWEIETAGWALSVMREGGRAIIPQEPHVSHGDALRPARPLILWTYTDMSDPRWTWGERFIQLRQDPDADTPQKGGVCNSLGWAAYAHEDHVFLKRYPATDPEAYTDYGANTEFYTSSSMLELETLGPMRSLAPGEQLEHVEHWYLFETSVGEDEDAIQNTFDPLVEQTTQPALSSV